MNKADNYNRFRLVCYNGHIKIVKYLLETFKDPKMYKADNYFGFRLSC